MNVFEFLGMMVVAWFFVGVVIEVVNLWRM